MFDLQANHVAGGYHAQKRNREPEQITQPSINLRYTQDGAAYTRKGYNDSGWDLDNAGYAATTFHVDRYNITFFICDTDVKYVDHNNSDAVVDTGIALTTGETTWMDEYNGDLYLTNPTDGLQRIVITRLNGALTDVDTEMVIDKDGAARLSVFSKTTGDLIIGGTSEAFDSVTVATGVLTHTGTVSQAYSDNSIAIVVHDISSGRPKGNKMIFWKETMNVIGVGVDEADTTKSDIPPTTLYYTDFALASGSEKIIDFTNGGYEMVGKSGTLTNAVPTRDYMYLFKEDSTYFIAVANVNVDTGARPPVLFSAKYGCVNQFSADVMGDFVVWLAPQKRVIKSNIQVEDGISALYPDEEFDMPIKEILEQLDDDQSSARVYYQTKAKELHIKCVIDSETVELVYDNNLGVWCPPDTNKNFNHYTEIDGEPYATSDNDDTVYRLDDTLSDDGADIECTLGLGEFEFEDSRTTLQIGDIAVSGSLSSDTNIDYKPVIDGNEYDLHNIDDTNVSFENLYPIGSIGIGGSVIAGGEDYEEEGEFDVSLSNYPATINRWQPVFHSFGDGHKFTIKSWSMKGIKAFNRPVLTTK